MSHRARAPAACALAALAVVLAADDAGAQWSADIAVERFSWREHTSPIAVRELGPRLAIGGGFTQPKSRGALWGYRGRVTFGSVSYNGSFQFDAAKPASGTSTYLGTTQGAELRYRWYGTADAVAGLEFDWWRRRLSSKQHEDYRIVSARLGAERGATDSNPFVGAAGMRFLLAAG